MSLHVALEKMINRTGFDNMEIINEIPFGLFRSNICNSMSEACRIKRNYS